MTLTGKGNFTGTITVKINITEQNLIAKAKVNKIPNKPYDKVNKAEDYRVTLTENDLVVYMKKVTCGVLVRTGAIQYLPPLLGKHSNSLTTVR